MASKRYEALRVDKLPDMHNNDLLRACRDDSYLLGELLQENKDYIFSVLIKYKGNIRAFLEKFNLEEEELLQVATIGVLTALRDFDFERGIKFTTFVVRPILWELNQFIYSDNQTVRLSRGAVELIKRIKEVEDVLGYLPDEDILAEQLKVSKERILETIRFTQDMANIDDIQTHACLVDEECSMEDEALNRVYVQQLIEGGELSDMEMDVVTMIMTEGLNNSQIADRLGVYPMTINRTINRIRDKMENTHSDDRKQSKYESEIELLVEEMRDELDGEHISVKEMTDLLDVCGYDISEYTPRILYYIRQKAIQKLEGGTDNE